MPFCASLGLALARFFELTSELFLTCAKYFLNEEESDETEDENSDEENDVIGSLQSRKKNQEDEGDAEDDVPSRLS